MTNQPRCQGLSSSRPGNEVDGQRTSRASWPITAGAYPGFCPGWDASPSQVTSQRFFRFPWVERGTVTVKCLAQEQNAMARPGLEPGPLDPESSALTTRPPRLPQTRLMKNLL